MILIESRMARTIGFMVLVRSHSLRRNTPLIYGLPRQKVSNLINAIE